MNSILQWKTVFVLQSADGNMVVVDDSWPVAFPNTCLSVNPSLSSSLIYVTSGAPFVNTAIVDRVKCKAACAYTKSNSTVTVWGGEILITDYVFSPDENAFYLVALKDDYLTAGIWPSDGISMGADDALVFMGEAPECKARGIGDVGLLCWDDLPPPTHEE